jgi:hypothetical protein
MNISITIQFFNVHSDILRLLRDILDIVTILLHWQVPVIPVVLLFTLCAYLTWVREEK